LRHKSKNKEKYFQSLSPSVHFRLCHFCLHLNESPTEAVRCGRCQRSLLTEVKSVPMQLQKDLLEDEDYEEVPTGEQESVRRLPGHPRRRVPRLTGLSVDW
jgi:hypothetical protein